MRTARATNVRGERPSSAELEAVYDEAEENLKIEELRGEAEYEPLPQGPPTPAVGTPAPATPVPGTARPQAVQDSDNTMVPVVPYT